MMNRNIWWLVTGALGGLLGARMLARPGGRRFLKGIIRRVLVAKSALESEWALAREDFADLVAEAREEHRQSLEAQAAEAAAHEVESN